MKLEIARRALRDTERCARWWRENRPAAPTLFEEELREAFDRIRAAPQFGSAYDAAKDRWSLLSLVARTLPALGSSCRFSCRDEG